MKAKKIAFLLFTTVCFCLVFYGGLSEEEMSTVPENLSTYLESQTPSGYSVAWCYWMPTGTPDQAYVILKHEDENKLLALEMQEGGWHTVATSTGALLQGDLLPEVTMESTRYFYMSYEIPNYRNELYMFYREADGKWYLCDYFIDAANFSRYQFVTKNDQISYALYRNNKPLTDTVTVYGRYQRELQSLDLASLPRTPQEAQTMFSTQKGASMGDFPSTDVAFAKDERYPVYSGPGVDYRRAANGKAAVSTNDWIRVFGAEDNWAFIQYSISASQMRFGYIQATNIPQGTQLDPLSFSPDLVNVLKDTTITDDPLGESRSVGTLHAGQANCYRLATLNEHWVYVEAVLEDGQKIRGFVAPKDIALVAMAPSEAEGN